VRPLYFLLPVLAYLYGSIPYGFLMTKWLKGVDLRQVGSGNIGATNAARVLGFKFFPAVFLLDFSKGFLPTLIAAHLTASQTQYHPHPLAVVAALAGMLGHAFPIYLGFKGGKAVAAGTGALLVLATWAALVGVAVWVVVFAIWRYVSLASITAAVAAAVAVWLTLPDPLGSNVFGTAAVTLAAALVIVLHRANIQRLLSGTEHKIGKGGPTTPPAST